MSLPDHEDESNDKAIAALGYARRKIAEEDILPTDAGSLAREGSLRVMGFAAGVEWARRHPATAPGAPTPQSVQFTLHEGTRPPRIVGRKEIGQ